MCKQSTLRRLAFTICSGYLVICAHASAQSSAKLPPALTRVEQVRSLSPERASLGYPVRIRGVITMDAPAPDFFVQDATAGIYVEGNASAKFPHVLGQLVEIEGTTGPGKFAPVIREVKLHVLGAGALPKAQLFSLSQLTNGQQDSQWAQIRGIVRSVALDRSSWHETTLAMHVASEGGEFNVRVPINHEQDFLYLVDSEVLIEGVCGTLYNANRQLTGILFYVPRLSFIKVEAPATEVPVSGLLQFSPEASTRHRVRVRGLVAYQQLGNALFLQVESQGLRVLTQQNTPVEIGDLVDVLGFPAMGESEPILEDAVFQRVGHQKPPEPLQLNLDGPWEQFDSAMVNIEAKLLSRQVQPEGIRLQLQTGEIIFDATVPPGSAADDLLAVPLNSKLRVTGICLVRSGGMWRTPQSFRLLLRSPQDVLVLTTPSWWNLRHTVWLLAITMGVLLIVMAWVVHLGRRVRKQMQVIRQKLRHGAVLEERNRIARELHDNLEQELAGITMQLDLASDCFQQAPRIARQALEAARDMSRHSMVEARRSVWDLRCQLLEDGDLVSAIAQIVEPLIKRDGVKVDVKIQGAPVRLPGQIEMNLLRIGQEAVANAVRHGSARQIEIQLHYASASVTLTVTDDGSGFSANQSPPSGHFGLLDMSERAQSMGSHLQVESQPGHGTRVEVNIPVDSSEAHHAALKTNTYSGS